MPGLDLYANMCNIELWNRERTTAYVRNGLAKPGMRIRCDPCDNMSDLIACVEDRPPEPDGYRLPELDPAPWYDETRSESMNFAGLLVMEATLSPALDRRLVQNIGHGGVLTRARYSGRTLDVRGLLLGATCCAVTYGLGWLTQALLGEFCGGCDGCTLAFATCCPSSACGEDCITVIEGGVQVPYFRSSPDQEWTRGTDFIRYMCGAGVLSGPEVTGTRGKGCGCGCGTIAEVEFTIGIALPWLYHEEVEVYADQPIGSCEDFDCDIVFVKGDDCRSCAPPDSCADDPNCGQPVLPPVGSIPAQQCGCLPLTSKRTCFALDGGSQWFERALILELYAGSSPLRNVAVRVFPNPVGYDCCGGAAEADYFNDCNACGTLFVDYVPANGTLLFDSACRKVTVTCGNQTFSGSKNLSTTDGLPFRWIELTCQPACVAVDVDCDNVADDATVSMRFAERELA